jgi:hypothetical protein
MRLVQLKNNTVRRVAVVEEPNLVFLAGVSSVYDLAQQAMTMKMNIAACVAGARSPETLAYDEVYADRSPWSFLPAFDHPHEAARCLVSGTGLTHLGSAKDRNAMHNLQSDQMTDSMRIFQWGLEGGKPAEGCIGPAPEWFYKGNGYTLRGHGEALVVPPYAEDGGEEAEVAVCYVVSPEGIPFRVGMATGNEFSDHVFEKKNYLNLAGSKLRTCALGPELVINPEFNSVPGTVLLQRNGETIWSSAIHTGEEEMCHSLHNIEHHHFKFEGHRIPGDAHVHFLGAGLLSFGAGIHLRDRDVMEIAYKGMGRPLRNTVHWIPKEKNAPVTVQAL